MCKICHACGKDYIWNPATCNCQNQKYLASIIDDSANYLNYKIIKGRNES